MGSSFSGGRNERPVVSAGKEAAHKCPRINSSKISHHDFHLQQGGYQCNPHSNGQPGSPEISCKNGGNSECHVGSYKQRNSELFVEEKYHNYSRVSTGSFECGSRQGHKDSKGLKQIEFSSGPTRDRPLCFEGSSSAPSVRLMETRSLQSSDAFQISWADRYAYDFPPFSLVGRVLLKAQQDKSCLLLIAPVWQNQTWFPLLLRMCVRDPIKLPCKKHLLTDPQGNTHPLILNHSKKCVCSTIDAYLERLQPWREGRSQLFLSYVKPKC